jgi:hypothetical protein
MNSECWMVVTLVWESDTGASTVVQQKRQGMEARCRISDTCENNVEQDR